MVEEFAFDNTEERRKTRQNGGSGWVEVIVGSMFSGKSEELIRRLRRAQIAAELHLAGRAKGAGEWAARLRRKADRPPPVAVAHQDCLDRMAFVGTEERLDRAVARARFVDERERRERHAIGEPRPKLERQIRHLVVARGPARSPTPDLPRAVPRLVGKRLFEELQVHRDTVALRSSSLESHRP